MRIPPPIAWGVAVALVSSLAACGQDDDDSSGTIEFSLTGGTVPAQTQVITDAIADFETDHPDATVELTEVGWDSAYSQYQTRLQGSNAPDVALLAPPWVATFAERNAFTPVEDLVDTELLDSFYASGYDGMTDDSDQRLGVPWDASVWGFFYRQDLFEAAGLDPERPPQTWDEVLEYSAALQDEGIGGVAFPAEATEPDGYFLPLMWQAGADVVIEEDGQFESAIESAETERAAEFVFELSQNGYMPTDVTGMDWEGVMNSFVAGDVAMMYNGMWATDALRENAPELDGEWATARSPAGPESDTQLGYPNALVIAEQSDNPELAAEFIEFLFDEDTGAEHSYYFEFMKVTNVVGWTTDFADIDDEFVRDPMIAPFLDAAPDARGRPVAGWYEEFRQRSFGPGIQSLILGDLTPDELVAELASGVDSVQQN